MNTLADILVRKKVLPQTHVQHAQMLAQEHQATVAHVVVRAGMLDSMKLALLLSRNLRLDFVAVEQKQIPRGVVDRVPWDVANRCRVMPLGLTKSRGIDKLILGMTDPTDVGAIEEIEGIAQLDVVPVIIDEVGLQRVLNDLKAPPMFERPASTTAATTPHVVAAQPAVVMGASLSTSGEAPVDNGGFLTENTQSFMDNLRIRSEEASSMLDEDAAWLKQRAGGQGGFSPDLDVDDATAAIAPDELPTPEDHAASAAASAPDGVMPVVPTGELQDVSELSTDPTAHKDPSTKSVSDESMASFASAQEAVHGPSGIVEPTAADVDDAGADDAVGLARALASDGERTLGDDSALALAMAAAANALPSEEDGAPVDDSSLAQHGLAQNALVDDDAGELDTADLDSEADGFSDVATHAREMPPSPTVATKPRRSSETPTPAVTPPSEPEATAVVAALQDVEVDDDDSFDDATAQMNLDELPSSVPTPKTEAISAISISMDSMSLDDETPEAEAPAPASDNATQARISVDGLSLDDDTPASDMEKSVAEREAERVNVEGDDLDDDTKAFAIEGAQAELTDVPLTSGDDLDPSFSEEMTGELHVDDELSASDLIGPLSETSGALPFAHEDALAQAAMFDDEDVYEERTRAVSALEVSQLREAMMDGRFEAQVASKEMSRVGVTMSQLQEQHTAVMEAKAQSVSGSGSGSGTGVVDDDLPAGPAGSQTRVEELPPISTPDGPAPESDVFADNTAQTPPRSGALDAQTKVAQGPSFTAHELDDDESDGSDNLTVDAEALDDESDTALGDDALDPRLQERLAMLQAQGLPPPPSDIEFSESDGAFHNGDFLNAATVVESVDLEELVVCVVGADKAQKRRLAGALAIAVQTVSFLADLDEARSWVGRIDVDVLVLVKPTAGLEFTHNLSRLPDNDGLPFVVAMADDDFPLRVKGVHLIRPYPDEEDRLGDEVFNAVRDGMLQLRSRRS